MVEIVQDIGRALRLNRDGSTKVARIIMPVPLEPGEDPTGMLASASFRPLRTAPGPPAQAGRPRARRRTRTPRVAGHALGDSARGIELRRSGHLIASAITLLDQHRYHYWCVGVDYAAAPGFSPFYAVFADVMRDAIASGRSRIELGRRNPDFKRRYGMHATPLCAYIAAI